MRLWSVLTAGAPLTHHRRPPSRSVCPCRLLDLLEEANWDFENLEDWKQAARACYLSALVHDAAGSVDARLVAAGMYKLLMHQKVAAFATARATLAKHTVQ